MIKCDICKSSGMVIVKMQAHELETHILCEKHAAGQIYEAMEPMIVETITIKDDPVKFQKEVAKLAQEMITV